MIGTIPKVERDQMYSIREAADALQLHRNTLRRYTDDIRIFSCSINKVSGRKVYTGAQILNGWKKFYGKATL